MTIRRLLPSLLAVLAMAAASACGGGGSADDSARRGPTTTNCPSATTEPIPGCPIATTTTTAASTTTTAKPSPPKEDVDHPPRANPSNPAVIITPGEDVPNPFVVVEDKYYMFATQAWVGPRIANITMRTSSDYHRWSAPVDVLPHLPGWVKPYATWAPDVRRVATGYVMYFTARLHRTPVTECIGVATSDTITGPYHATDKPFICQLDRRGSIDPRTIVEPDGSLWIHWKSDDNADTEGTTHTTIYARQLTPDGLGFIGPEHRILEADQPWEGRIVEAPHMFLHDGKHWLFYSGNWFNQPAYAIGVAVCDGPAGPCRKLKGPWLASNAQGQGPGEGSLFVDKEGRTFIVYAPFGQNFDKPTSRPVALLRVGWTAYGPYPGAT